MKDSERSYRDIFDNSIDAIFVHDTDTGQIIDANIKACDIFGYSLEEMKNLEVGALSLNKPPYTQKEALWWIRKASEEGPQQFEWLAKNREGRLIWFENILLQARVADKDRILVFARNIDKRKRSEEALRKKEKKFDAAVGVAELDFWDFSFETGEITTSESSNEKQGYAADEIEFNMVAWQELIHPDDTVLISEAFSSCLEGKAEDFDFEYRRRAKSGDWKWILVRGSVVERDCEGKAVRMSGTHMDISKHKKTEDNLRESEERFRRLFEGSLDAIFLADAESGIIIDANPAASELLMKPYEEIVGVHQLQIHPPHLAELAANIFKVIKQDIEEVLPVEFSVQRSDGKEVPVEILAQIIQIGGVPYAHGTFRDISQRKATEEELRESERRFRDITENAMEMIWEVDAEGRYTYVSPNVEDIIGYKPEEMIGRHFFDLIHAEDRDELKESALVLFSNKDRFREFTKPNVHKNGTIVWMSASGVPIHTRDGDFAGYRGANIDITGRRRAEEELRKVQKLESLGVLAGGIAHDFNNILTGIMSNISMVRLFSELDEDTSEMLADAEKAGLRAKDLTQQLLTFAKGGVPIRKPASMAELLREASNFALSGSNVRCEYRIPDDLGLVEIDEGQVSQVIHNLVINADQAMPKGGTIEIRAENVSIGLEDVLPLEMGAYLKITIADDGIGISQKHLASIFDPFFTTKQKGSGLGLATSFSIINNHEGHIQVDSNVDVGTTVNVYLPISEKTMADDQGEREQLLPGRGRILLIDDEEVVRKSAGGLLRRLGYEVEVAEDGDEGIDFYSTALRRGQPFDAVILDLTIPGGMGGKEAVKVLRRMDPESKIIVSSGYSDDPVISEFREHGFVACIVKPYGVDTLADTLHKVMGETE